MTTGAVRDPNDIRAYAVARGVEFDAEHDALEWQKRQDRAYSGFGPPPEQNSVDRRYFRPFCPERLPDGY